MTSSLSTMTKAAGVFLLAAFTLAPAKLGAQSNCQGYQAWTVQSNPQTDAEGLTNNNFPDANATYWGTRLNYPAHTVVAITGQFPEARYMSFQLYDSNDNFVAGLDDVQIVPDPGQNNPYVSGISQGTYTIQVVFGIAPQHPTPNTLYTGNTNSINLLYRIYYPNTPTNLPGGPVNPVLPNVSVSGTTLPACPPAPIISPITNTVYGRLDLIDYIGTPPANQPAIPELPNWVFRLASPFTPYFPSADGNYLAAFIDRAFLTAPYNYNMVVIQLKPPTIDDTQAGALPYAGAQVRYWSVCENDSTSTAVVRCVADDQAPTLNGLATFVISDPSYAPSASLLSQWAASWMPWGALENGDVVYNAQGQPLTNADGVFYYGIVLYRQLEANPSFAQSIANVANLAPARRQAAMGAYYPTIGYCTSAAFAQSGAGCIGQ